MTTENLASIEEALERMDKAEEASNELRKNYPCSRWGE